MINILIPDLILIRIWTKDEVGTCKTGLSTPLKYFYWLFQGGTSFVDHPWDFCLVFVMLSCASVYWCLVVTCWHIDSRLRSLIVSLLLSHWYPWSGVVLDCIDSWSLPSFLLELIYHPSASHFYARQPGICYQCMYPFWWWNPQSLTHMTWGLID